MSFFSIAGRPSVSFPGVLTRPNEPTETVTLLPNASTPPTRYGDPVVITTGNTIRPIEAGDTTASIYGALHFSFPTTQASWPPAQFNTAPTGVPTGENLAIVRKGYISVFVGSGTPALGGAVYVRTIAHTGVNTVVGSIDAVADGSDNFQWIGAEWASSGVDSNGYGEIRIFGI